MTSVHEPVPASQPQPASPAPVENWQQFLTFHGNGKELFIIFLKNFFLSILTLGIYSFWGRVRTRKFLWANTRLWGEPFEYTGTGRELFVSFLIVMVFFIIGSIGFSLLQLMLPPVGSIILSFCIMLGLFYLMQFATYRALRYRLSRTKWRGIRGNLGGKANHYACRALLYTPVIICSLGLLAPWVISRMVGYIVNNVHFGNHAMQFSGKAKGLYKIFIINIAVLIGLSALAFGAFSSFLPSFNTSHEFPSTGGLLMMFSPFLAVLLAYFLFSSFLHAALTRWFFHGLAFREVHMRSTLEGSTLLHTRLYNLLLVICTVGLGYAWAYVRTLRVTMNSTQSCGDPQLASLLQDTLPAPKRGEGLLEALDLDLSL
ncbi:YjgN family protein [Desulfovibrio cuneatus]|uniref:YjgN family protein n=1 Tax=Desulfovibrio cuneatus TaxID=159728 RepID=UPI00040FE074|nr:YjgN family protein [Desulfovibrio cuneatus]